MNTIIPWAEQTAQKTKHLKATIRDQPAAIRRMDVKSSLSKLIEFHKAGGVSVETEPTASIPQNVIDLRLKLLHEELDEYQQAAQAKDLIEVADALTDLLYVLLGTFVSHGLQNHAVDLFEEVHKSNMSKFKGLDTALHREDGKVLKSPEFQKPNISAVLGQPRFERRRS